MSAADRNLAEAGALPSLAPSASGRSSLKDSTHSGSTVKDHEKNGDASHLEDGAAAEQTAVEKRYLRRLDWIILPAISTLYLFDYLDRQNVANAKLYGFDKGHDTPSQGLGPGTTVLTSSQWQLIIMISYVGLVLFQVPGCIGFRFFAPSKWIAFSVCGWAVASLLQTVAFNLAGELACRIFLGIFEGLFGTGMVYYLSLWYHRTELGVRVFWYLGPTAVAGAFGGIIAFGIGHVQSATPVWKWLFLVEAAPCFCLGLFCLYWLPDRPLQNSRFTSTDQQIAEARFRKETLDQNDSFRIRDVLASFQDWKIYAQAAVYLPTAAMISSISGFLPTIVANMGYTAPATANLMTVPPYAIAFVFQYLASYISDRLRVRGPPITILLLLAAIFYALLATLPSTPAFQPAKYACMCLAVATVYATYPLTHAWPANNLGSETKRAVGLGLYTAIGNLGSIAGTWFYPATDAPQFMRGHWLCVGMALMGGLMAAGNTLLLWRINRTRDKRFGKPEKGRTVDVTGFSDGARDFRYII